ncbi:hypothetical protein F4859DRAFT_519648 [Xylaria cf. heliscus]|nr:hypothetical protein F4859DRAFT_519648 [Xylaria cf. heliscus]
MGDMQRAIEYLQVAVDLTPKDDPALADRPHALSIGYYAGIYEQLGSETALKKSIQLDEKAVEITQKKTQNGQDDLLIVQLVVDLEQSIRYNHEALDHTTSPVFERLVGGMNLIMRHATNIDWPKAYDSAHKTMSVIPLPVSRSLEDSDKQSSLMKGVDLASDAAATAL